MNWSIILGFLTKFWSEIIYLVCALAALIISLCKKRGKMDPAIERVIRCLPLFIKDAEVSLGPKCGQFKKQRVLNSALGLYEKLTGIHITCDSYIAEQFCDAIEDILNTPQKKEEK